jgi:hypothetical protein
MSGAQQTKNHKATSKKRQVPLVAHELLRPDHLVEKQKEVTSQYKHAANTRQTYKSAHDCAIRWIHQLCDENPEDETIKKYPSLRQAFEDEPKDCSGKALAMYITHKCFSQGCKAGTGMTAYSALKKHWEEL